MNVYYCDVTQTKIRKKGYYVSRILIPKLYPFYLLEDYPYFGGRRMYELPKKLGYINTKTTEQSLNKFPHPFI